MELIIHLFTFWMFVCTASKYFNGVSGQELTLSMNDNDQKTPCTQPVTHGLRYGMSSTQNNDVFLFRGIVNATGINLTAMSDLVYFQRNKNNTGYSTDCAVYLSQGCSTAVGDCYCTSKNNQTYHLVYTNYADIRFLDSDIRIEWDNANGSVGALSNVIKMPPLYDVTNPNYPPIELTLTVNGRKYPISGQFSGQCNFSLIANQANKLELTPNKAARPCYLRISLSSGSVQSSDYVSITVTPANENVTTDVEIAYSMCVPGNSLLGSCVAASTIPRKCCKEHCCRVSITIIVLGSALFVIGIVLAILLYLQKILFIVMIPIVPVNSGRTPTVGIILVKVYTGASSACGAVSLIIGAISTSEYCERICTSDPDHNCCQICEDDSLEDCPLGIVSAVLIGACAVTFVLGVALLIYHCCHKKKWKSDFPGGSSSTELATNTNRHNNGSSRNN